MAGGCDEVQESMDTVVTESWVTLDSRLLGQNVIILALEVSNDFREAKWCQPLVFVMAAKG